MKWNKVRAKVAYKSGKYEVDLYVQSYYEVGDMATCTVKNSKSFGKGSYETTCVITEILARDVTRQEKSVIVHDRSETNHKEDKEMVDNLFNVAVVRHECGRTNYCRTSMDLSVGDTVVYALIDVPTEKVGKMHVGAVERVISVGSKSPEPNAWIVQLVSFDQYHDDLHKENTYSEIMSKLEAKKKQFEELAFYRIIAETDPEARDLLNTLSTLQPNTPRHYETEKPVMLETGEF